MQFARRQSPQHSVDGKLEDDTHIREGWLSQRVAPESLLTGSRLCLGILPILLTGHTRALDMEHRLLNTLNNNTATKGLDTLLIGAAIRFSRMSWGGKHQNSRTLDHPVPPLNSLARPPDQRNILVNL